LGVTLDVNDVQERLRKEYIHLIGTKSKKARQFLRKNFEKWIESMVKVKTHFEENVDYVVSKNSEIRIIDNGTGETMKDVRWKNGLHFFLELKHAIFPKKMKSSGFFENHFEFFREYGPNIIGFTGTLGSPHCCNFLERIYKVDCLRMPRFKQRIFKEKPPTFCRTRSDWHCKILRVVNRIKNKKRLVLILFQTIKQALQFSKLLEKQGIRHVKYIRSDLQKFEEIQEQLNNNSIIIATNLAGRGTDISIPEHFTNRGMHVVMTFLAENLRVEEQAFGRTARKGQPGSGQLIVNLENNRYLPFDVEGFLKGYEDGYELNLRDCYEGEVIVLSGNRIQTDFKEMRREQEEQRLVKFEKMNIHNAIFGNSIMEMIKDKFKALSPKILGNKNFILQVIQRECQLFFELNCEMFGSEGLTEGKKRQILRRKGKLFEKIDKICAKEDPRLWNCKISRINLLTSMGDTDAGKAVDKMIEMSKCMGGLPSSEEKTLLQIFSAKREVFEIKKNGGSYEGKSHEKNMEIIRRNRGRQTQRKEILYKRDEQCLMKMMNEEEDEEEMEEFEDQENLEEQLKKKADQQTQEVEFYNQLSNKQIIEAGLMGKEHGLFESNRNQSRMQMERMERHEVEEQGEQVNDYSMLLKSLVQRARKEIRENSANMNEIDEILENPLKNKQNFERLMKENEVLEKMVNNMLNLEHSRNQEEEKKKDIFKSLNFEFNLKEFLNELVQNNKKALREERYEDLQYPFIDVKVGVDGEVKIEIESRLLDEYEIDTYVHELEDEHDTLVGSIFKYIFGAAKIVLGIGLVGVGGPTAFNLASSFVYWGFNDIVNQYNDNRKIDRMNREIEKENERIRKRNAKEGKTGFNAIKKSFQNVGKVSLYFEENSKEGQFEKSLKKVTKNFNLALFMEKVEKNGLKSSLSTLLEDSFNKEEHKQVMKEILKKKERSIKRNNENVKTISQKIFNENNSKIEEYLTENKDLLKVSFWMAYFEFLPEEKLVKKKESIQSLRNLVFGQESQAINDNLTSLERKLSNTGPRKFSIDLRFAKELLFDIMKDPKLDENLKIIGDYALRDWISQIKVLVEQLLESIEFGGKFQRLCNIQFESSQEFEEFFNKCYLACKGSIIQLKKEIEKLDLRKLLEEGEALNYLLAKQEELELKLVDPQNCLLRPIQNELKDFFGLIRRQDLLDKFKLNLVNLRCSRRKRLEVCHLNLLYPNRSG
jgi:hypothetical protein